MRSRQSIPRPPRGRLLWKLRDCRVQGARNEALLRDSCPASSFLVWPAPGRCLVLRTTLGRPVPFETVTAIRLIGFVALTWALTRNEVRPSDQLASRAAREGNTLRQTPQRATTPRSQMSADPWAERRKACWPRNA